jgi:hypothetical protein
MPTGQSSDAFCATCRHFVADAGALEHLFPGLTAMASAYSAARGDSGLCQIHDRFCRPDDSCSTYEQQATAVPASGVGA